MSSLNIDLQKIDNKLDMKVDMNSSVFQRILESISKSDFYKNISSPSVAQLSKAVINSGMKYALTNNLIKINPAEKIRLSKSKSKNNFKVLEIEKSKTLNEEQIKLLIEKSKDTPIYMQILFAVLMGLRKSEINGLKYDDVDYNNRMLHIKRQLGVKPNMVNKNEIKKGEYTKQEIKLKSMSSERVLKIPDIVFEAILEERKKYEKNRRRRRNDKINPFKDYGFICCSTYGNPRSKSFHFKYWKKLLKENNLPNIRFHDLRATYATILLKQNFTSKAVSKTMGHKMDIITVDIYADNTQICDCLEELEEYIEKVKPKRKDVTDFSEDEEIINITENFIKELKLDKTS